MDKLEKCVETLIQKASDAGTALEALQLSQAACNAANAMCALGCARKDAKS